MFKPKHELPYWKMIYEFVLDLEVGTVMTFKDLSEVIDEDIMKNRASVYRASKQLQIEKKRMLIAERGVGYKVVEGTAVVYHAEERHSRANKQIKLANFEARHVNTTVLTPDEKKRLNEFMVHNRRIQQALTEGVENIEEATKQTIVAQAFTAKEILRLRELLGEK